VRDESGNTATEWGNRSVFATRRSRAACAAALKQAHRCPKHAIETLSWQWELRHIADVVVTETCCEGKAPT